MVANTIGWVRVVLLTCLLCWRMYIAIVHTHVTMYLMILVQPLLAAILAQGLAQDPGKKLSSSCMDSLVLYGALDQAPEGGSWAVPATVALIAGGIAVGFIFVLRRGPSRHQLVDLPSGGQVRVQVRP